MGLAASQARFLNLTARKSNLEYEGQQINQQRTVLSNSSANYYSQMLTLQVPTPPSTESYKKVSYQFTQGVNGTARISQVTPNGSGSYTIVYTDTWTAADVMSKLLNEDTITKNNDDSFTYADGSKSVVKIASDSTNEDAKALASSLDSIKEQIAAVYGNGKTKDNIGDIYVVNCGTQAAPSYKFFVGSDLPSTKNSSKNIYGYRQTEVEKYQTSTISNATITRDSSNRISSFTTTTGGTVSVSNVEITDEEAYNNAYNQYTYETYLYNQAMDEINAQTSIIQAKDKQLELRLKQLDTEHNAINTEIDSLSSVIKDNSEKSFKTFA